MTWARIIMRSPAVEKKILKRLKFFFKFLSLYTFNIKLKTQFDEVFLKGCKHTTVLIQYMQELYLFLVVIKNCT